MEKVVCSIVILIVFVLVYWSNKKSEQTEAEKNADEFMKKHFGENYKDKFKH